MPTRMKLTDINLLEVLSSPACSESFKEFREFRFQKKELIFFPNEEHNLIFVIKSGRVRVYLVNEEKEFTLSILEPGDIFSTHTRAFCQAMDNTSILVANISVLQKIIKEIPDIALTMVQVLGELLKNSITIINGLAFKETRSRLIEFLVNAAKDKGIKTAKGIKVKIGLNNEDLAMIVGSTRQTVSTLINDLLKLAVIEKLDRGTFLIKDIEKLQKVNN